MENPAAKDEKLCRGCLCKIIATAKRAGLAVMCHGNPFLLNKDSSLLAECPCSICLIKPVCTNTCTKYTLYKGLCNGTINIKIYNETY